MISEVAPAKVNVYLHVGPVRRDGLHDHLQFAGEAGGKVAAFRLDEPPNRGDQ